MGSLTEEDLAKALAAAVEHSAASGMRDLEAVRDRLDDFLYRRGGDGILDLSVSQTRPPCISLLGIVIWVETQTLAPIEAEFDLDPTTATVKAFTVRAGDGRISRHDAPGYPLDSWRKRLRFIESRPTVDDDWEHVLHHQFD
jgi:hypothetical protein